MEEMLDSSDFIFEWIVFILEGNKDTPGGNYTPGIYADGYIVFAFPFVRSYVRSFVRSWNLRQSFALKFLKWCISQQLLIRKHSYLDHSYHGGKSKGTTCVVDRDVTAYMVVDRVLRFPTE